MNQEFKNGRSVQRRLRAVMTNPAELQGENSILEFNQRTQFDIV